MTDRLAAGLFGSAAISRACSSRICSISVTALRHSAAICEAQRHQAMMRVIEPVAAHHKQPICCPSASSMKGKTDHGWALGTIFLFVQVVIRPDGHGAVASSVVWTKSGALLST